MKYEGKFIEVACFECDLFKYFVYSHIDQKYSDCMFNAVYDKQRNPSLVGLELDSTSEEGIEYNSQDSCLFFQNDQDQ